MPKDWTFCNDGGCTGVQLDPFGQCLAHLQPADLETYLDKVARDRVIDARGVEISPELFLRFTRRVPDKHWMDVQFDEATFLGDATFTTSGFEHRASFYKAVFNGEPNFDSTTFGCTARFTGAHFLTERDWASFSNSRFEDQALFDGVDCHCQFHFGTTRVRSLAKFDGAHFRSKATFDPTEFLGTARFCEVTFDSIADFGGSQFASPPDFSGATFHSELQLDGLRVMETPDNCRVPPASGTDRSIVLDNVEFDRGVDLKLGAQATLEVKNSLFAGPSTIRGTATTENEYPRVLSLQGSDVGNLLLSRVNLSPCRFAGAHNLDRLRMEERTPFLYPPKWRESVRRRPLQFWTRREVLFEEALWRSTQGSSRPPPGPASDQALEPTDVAAIYRSLRKGREDNKDAPGASDLYYGEMDMRRKSKPFLSTEGFVLFWYWLLSGYALRASRAFVSLVVFTGISTLLLYHFGFTQSVSAGHALAAGIQNTTNLLGLQRDPLINGGWGLVIYAIQHLVGTLLIGLTVVSFRGRLQR